jgi:hypothetical protein
MKKGRGIFGGEIKKGNFMMCKRTNLTKNCVTFSTSKSSVPLLETRVNKKSFMVPDNESIEYKGTLNYHFKGEGHKKVILQHRSF